MSEWGHIPLSRTTKFVVDNRGRTAPTDDSGIPLIATNCVNNTNLYPSYENLRYVSQETYDNWFRSHPQPGDILLTLKGSQNGAVCLVPDPVGFVIAQDMVALRIDENIIDPLFVFAVLRSPDVQSQIKNLDVSGVIPHLKKSDFDKLILPYPEPPIQKEIGDFYFNLSCKIDLLHRQNKTLEAIAETLFRQWFIEEAQEDWEEGPLDDVISVKGGTTPSTKEPEYWDGDIHWTSPRDLSNHNSVFLFDTDRKITEKGLAQIGSGLLPIGTVLLSSRAPIGYLAITDIPVAINQGYIAIICDKSISNYFMYLWCKANMKEIKNAGNGSVFQEISKSNFKTLEIQIPSSRILDNFERAISPTFEKIKANQKQIQTLEKLRDTLLPKLMSGEVRVAS
jgi:type I restriction enzyme S subunit